jgi:DNA-directed RNA polymerase subunit RPC12/RpoP
VAVELKCEGCGKTLKAQDDQAGKRSKCPACGHEVYIPMPEDKIEELPLAPQDEQDIEQEQELLQETRDIEHSISQEPANTAGKEPHVPSRAGSAATSQDIQSLVIEFLIAMRDSDLDKANSVMPALKQRRDEAIEAVDILANEAIPPDEMGDVPPAVYQGFLKNLRSQL